MSKKPNSVASALNKILADCYILTLKTHGCHWNVEGHGFHGMHILLEEHYTMYFKAADEVAERIRALDEKAPASFAEYKKMGSIDELSEPVSSIDGIVKLLVADYKTFGDDLKEAIELADDGNDPDTADMLTTILHDVDKGSWMLKASAKK